MAQAKTKKEKPETFDPTTINWDKHKRKMIDVSTTAPISPTTTKTLTLDELRERALVEVDAAISSARDKLYRSYPDCIDVTARIQYGSIYLSAKTQEATYYYERRVKGEEEAKWREKKYLEINREKIKKEELAIYEKLKKKYNL
jgi:hypothetical protein